MSDPTDVVNCDEFMRLELQRLLAPYHLVIKTLSLIESIPGSFFGEREAGLIGNILYIRPDTPVHSALHEACHYICMDNERRTQLDSDAEGDFDEENGVCYLQVLLAGYLTKMGRAKMLRDMDRWGYTFRLGSAKMWFENDAGDAYAWLAKHHLIKNNEPSWQLRH